MYKTYLFFPSSHFPYIPLLNRAVLVLAVSEDTHFEVIDTFK